MMLENKVVLVTGAARGMGKAIALQFAQEGACVAAADIDGTVVRETVSMAEDLGLRALAIQADVGNLSEIDRMVTGTLETFGRIDILVNNAGVTRLLDVMEISEEDWDFIHRVNAKGAFFCMQRVAKELIAQGQGGRIINIASLAGKGNPDTSNAAYAASKGAVVVMTQVAAHQLAPYDININSICPGTTNTPMGETLAGEASQRLGISLEEVERRRLSKIPIGRPNAPEDIANLAVFLAGPGARNITGQSISVDGGRLLR